MLDSPESSHDTKLKLRRAPEGLTWHLERAPLFKLDRLCPAYLLLVVCSFACLV